MIEFKISAPGRIILSGEHAIMYEKCVVSASLDLRTTLKFCELPDEQGIIKIQFPAVDLSLDLPLETIRNFILFDDRNIIIPNKIRFVRYVRHFITLNGMWSTQEQRFSLQLFFLLLSSIAYCENLEIRPFHVNVTTDLFIGGGLGSSTSFAVCLAACFMHWARLQQDAHAEFDSHDLKQIYHHSSLYEEFIQNFAFGIDNYVCIFGKIIFSEYKIGKTSNITDLDVPRMEILLIDSNICQNNREWLLQMAELKHSNKTEFPDRLLNAMEDISIKIGDKLEEIIKSHRNPQPNTTSLLLQAKAYAELQELIQENQCKLRKSTLSHPTLDKICSIAETDGFAGKLTGFGGGFVYILLPPSTQEEQIRNLKTRLEKEGFDVTLTSVSCSGVIIEELNIEN